MYVCTGTEEATVVLPQMCVVLPQMCVLRVLHVHVVLVLVLVLPVLPSGR